MKLFLKRDTSDIVSRYIVYDDKGVESLIIGGKPTPSGERMYALKDDKTVLKIRQLQLPVLRAYSVFSENGSFRIFIYNRSNGVFARFFGISFYFAGDILSGNYEIVDADSSVICRVGRDYPGGHITLDVHQSSRSLICVAAAICVDSLEKADLPVLQLT